MIHRLALLLITLFWILMNVLLWRAEYGARKVPGAAVSPQAVWQKILTAPDSSSLTILYQGKKVGFCHWITSVGQELSRASEADPPPEGMVDKVAGYRVILEGNLALAEASMRSHFEGNLQLDKDQQWQEIRLRLNMRPAVWELRSRATERTVTLSMDDSGIRFGRVFKFSDFENPDALMRELLGPAAAGLVTTLGFTGRLPSIQATGLGLKWEARHDTLRIAHSKVRAYRLETRVLDRYSIVIIVSRVGEILKVQLPNDIVLVNDQLGSP